MVETAASRTIPKTRNVSFWTKHLSTIRSSGRVNLQGKLTALVPKRAVFVVKQPKRTDGKPKIIESQKKKFLISSWGT
jgi:hypothetical protein